MTFLISFHKNFYLLWPKLAHAWSMSVPDIKESKKPHEFSRLFPKNMFYKTHANLFLLTEATNEYPKNLCHIHPPPPGSNSESNLPTLMVGASLAPTQRL